VNSDAPLPRHFDNKRLHPRLYEIYESQLVCRSFIQFAVNKNHFRNVMIASEQTTERQAIFAGTHGGHVLGAASQTTYGVD
jgi:hypothetical protein